MSGTSPRGGGDAGARWIEDLQAEPDEVTARFLEMVNTVLPTQPPPESQDPIEHRVQADAEARANRKQVEQAEDRVVSIGGRDVRVRVMRPDTVRGAYLYIHGGAWMMGAPDLADEIMWARAEAAEVAVYGIDYRLAPEQPWPAQGDDCEAAALWFVEHAPAEVGCDRLIIGGESAGAHLSAVTLLRLRDRHGLAPFRGADLRYGMYDLRLTPSARLFDGAFLGPNTLRWTLDLCFDESVRSGPDASPLLADLGGLPPALFTVGTADSLLDDTLMMWTRWLAAGNQAELSVHPGCIHAFDYFPVPGAARALEDSIAFIRECVDAPPLPADKT